MSIAGGAVRELIEAIGDFIVTWVKPVVDVLLDILASVPLFKPIVEWFTYGVNLLVACFNPNDFFQEKTCLVWWVRSVVVTVIDQLTCSITSIDATVPGVFDASAGCYVFQSQPLTGSHAYLQASLLSSNNTRCVAPEHLTKTLCFAAPLSVAVETVFVWSVDCLATPNWPAGCQVRNFTLGTIVTLIFLITALAILTIVTSHCASLYTCMCRCKPRKG